MSTTSHPTVAGKKVLITGASSGLGAHFAAVMAGAGAEVMLAARRVDALDSVAAALRAQGGKVSTTTLDVTDAASVAALEGVIEGIDILINNAGIVRNGAALDQTEEDWDAVIDTNLKGMFLVAKSVAKAMTQTGRGGSIINIASILGLRQSAAVLPYAVSKAGVVQLTKVLALELARFNIRVNALAPGYFRTELNSEFWATDAGKALIRRIPHRRLGEYQDLDGPLMLLASDQSRYMSGSVLVVDGGHLVSNL